MKKFLAILLMAMMLFVLTSCGEDSGKTPSGFQQSGQSGSQDSTQGNNGATDTVTLVKENAFNFAAELDYVEDMSLTFDGDKIIKCSINETYADEESAKKGEAANKGNDQYVNVARDGNTVSYDYSEEWCNDSFEFFKGKDMTINHFTGEKGYMLQ